MPNSHKLTKAIQIATTAHIGQKDKSGAPYILHPLWVMNELLRKYPRDWEQAALGVLHDSKEDNPDYVTDSLLLESGFDVNFIADLNALTHDKNIPYMKYIDGVCQRIRVPRVKLEVLAHNSMIFRMKGLSKKISSVYRNT